MLHKLKHSLKFCSALVLLWACSPEKKSKGLSQSPYLNHNDSAKYVGIQTCKSCHLNIYQTFIQTGMGQSFDSAGIHKSKAIFEHSTIVDDSLDMSYHAAFSRNKLFITEFRREGKDTIHQRTEMVNYIVGSGQHTNSHILNTNGYLTQMPMTFYTQKKTWDLPPGFEHGNNTRFNRKIGLECMSCHNAYPEFVAGSENKYAKVPGGIDCERCHGPGSIHVSQKMNGQMVDTATQIDYSIVNPAKLSIDLQFDVCQRCHLQGNAVLKPGKSFYDFKPGQKLSDVMTVFLPKYANADKYFIMASHADRLKQSACFIKSAALVNKNDLKPYRNALTCLTCHNPHVSVKQTNQNNFNKACVNCHGGNKNDLAILQNKHQKLNSENCVSCHMPISGSIDIPHVSVHDHYIRKPVSEQEKNQIKQFLGLFAINEKNPEKLTKAEAYINQYEKFDNKIYFLDSAEQLLNSQLSEHALALKIQLYFVRQNFQKVITTFTTESAKLSRQKLFTKAGLSNNDAWTCYRLAESYTYLNNAASALPWIEQAVALAPYNLEFRNKLATTYAALNRINDAEKQWTNLIAENPNFVPAYTNLGYIHMQKNQMPKALMLFNKGLNLDPDNESLLLNLASFYLKENNKIMALKYLKTVVKHHPNNMMAKQALTQLNTNG